MIKLPLKSALILICLISFSGVINAQNEPVHAYEGKTRAENELVTLRFKGNKMAVKLWVFKVDGKLAPASGFYSTFNSTPTGNINLKLLPGQHELEIQNSTNIPQVITFTGEAGKEYTFEINKDQVSLVESEKVCSIEVREVPLYKSVAESEPNAVLVEDKDNGATTLFRIDGMAGTVVAKGWVTHHQFNSFLKGEYTTRLTPGTHSLDYYGSFNGVIELVSKTFNFEAGKTYTIMYEVKDLNSSIKYLKSSLVEVK
jgi:hypothetical protein